jgi:hypothetical protein
MNHISDTAPLVCISIGKHIRISATDGTETLASAHDTFEYISPDFTQWGCDAIEQATHEVSVEIYEQIRDAQYAELFRSIDKHLDRLVFTTSQIKSFILHQAHEFLLNAEWTCFRFLFKVKDEYVVADVRVRADGCRDVRITRLLDGAVRHAAYRHRIVVPKNSVEVIHS